VPTTGKTSYTYTGALYQGGSNVGSSTGTLYLSLTTLGSSSPSTAFVLYLASGGLTGTLSGKTFTSPVGATDADNGVNLQGTASLVRRPLTYAVNKAPDCCAYAVSIMQASCEFPLFVGKSAISTGNPFRGMVKAD